MWPIDDEWRRRVWAHMGEMEINDRDLAKLIGVEPASISQLFDRKNRKGAKRPKQSRLVPAIHHALGLALPSTTSANDMLSSINSQLSTLDEKDLVAVKAVIDAIASKRRS